MMRRIILITAGLFVFGFWPPMADGQQYRNLTAGETARAENTKWLNGYVFFANHPTLGRTPAMGEVITFYRVGRKDFFVAVRVREEGKYELFLPAGRYRVFVAGLNKRKDGFVDQIAPGQPRIVTVPRNSSGIKFDVDLILYDDSK